MPKPPWPSTPSMRYSNSRKPTGRAVLAAGGLGEIARRGSLAAGWAAAGAAGVAGVAWAGLAGAADPWADAVRAFDAGSTIVGSKVKLSAVMRTVGSLGSKTV